MKKIWKVLLCVVVIASMLLTTVAMAYPTLELPSSEPQNPLELTNVWNVRDIGGWETEEGYTIKTGKLYRSGNLHEADAAEIANLKVKKIIDLRTKLEAGRKPDVEVPGVKVVSISPLTIPNLFILESEDWKTLLHAITTGIMETWDANLYRQYIQDPKAIDATKQFFAEVLESNGAPILWHCTAGKDRTGIMAMLLMAALGCDVDDIRAEYLMTNYAYQGKAEASYDKAYKLTHIKAIATEFYKYEIVQNNWFDISLQVIRRMTGIDDDDNAALQEYLKTVIELTPDQIEQLKTTYLDEYGMALAG